MTNRLLQTMWALSLALGAVACGAEAAPADAPTEVADAQEAATDFRMAVTDLEVETACGQCQFGLESQQGCDLAVRIGDTAWFVSGTSIDEHGDAHAADGFCNAVRTAVVSGRVEGERFAVTAFELQPEDA